MKAESGEWRAVTKKAVDGYDVPVEIAFPSAMAISHMWLDKSHPDPNARNLRDMWLPAIEWLYSEPEAAWLGRQGRRRHDT